MKRPAMLLSQWFVRRMQRASPRYLAARLRPSPLSGERCAAACVGRELRELQGLLDQQLTAAQRAVSSLDAALECVADAWQEREDERVRYYELLRGILRVLDDCAELLVQDSAKQQTILRRFEQLLVEHHVRPMSIAPGDVFQSDLHQCEKLDVVPQQAPGSIVEIVQVGYVLQRPGGEQQVIRPARVVVNKELADESREPCPS